VITRLRRAARLAGAVQGFRSKVRVVVEAFLGRLLDGFWSHREITLVISIGSRAVRTVLNGRYELLVFEEVFLNREYDVSYKKQSPKVVIDLGANVGLTSLFFADRFPEATIHAVEPDPRTYARLCRNTDSFPNIKTHCIAIGAESGKARLHRDRQRSASSSLLARDTLGASTEVVCESLDKFLAGIKTIDIMKFDIEGAEWDVFNAASSKTLARLPELIGEVHFDLIPVGGETFYKLFSDAGFSIDRKKTAPRRELAHIVSNR